MRRRAHARCYGPREGAAPSLGCSWGLTTPRGRREGAGRGQRRRACEAAHWSSRAAGACACKGSRREKEEGDQAMACCGCRGASSGALRRPEVAGGAWQAVSTVRERTVARSRAPKWPAWPFSMQCGHGQRCLVALGGSKEWGGALDALGGHWVRREVRKERNAAVQKGKWGCFTLQSLS